MEKFELCLEQLIRLYVSYRQRYVLCLPGGRILTPRRRDKSYCRLTNNVLRNHLLRKYSVAVLAGAWGSKFICFDVDDGSKETVSAIIGELSRLGIPAERIYVSLSGSKGYHVEVFFSEIVSTQRLKDLHSYVIRAIGADPYKVEFRPTPGAAIKLPLSFHSKTGKIFWYVDRETLDPIESMEYILGINPLPLSEAVRALSLPSSKPSLDKAHPAKHATEEASNAPAFDSVGVLLTEEGTRHNIMRNIAVYQRTHGADKAECREILKDWYTCQDPSLIRSSPEHVRKDIEEIVSWVYSDRFQDPFHARKKDTALISTSHMTIVLNQRPRSARRLTFLLLARCRMREPQISAADASRVIDMSSNVVYKMLHRLVSSGVVTR